MNAQCYRVIFNKARGMLMVVSEAARSQGKTSNPTEGGSAINQVAGGSQTSSSSSNKSAYQAGKLITLRSQVLLALGLATIVATSAHADSTNIVADRNAAANQQAVIINTSSGKTQVNIQTPSAAGVSRNVFSKFDVGQDGAILNNSRTNAQTQLAGWVEGNPYLARGEARVILNEVNSSDPSRLSGYTEIAGGKAELIIANPAGITCAGCGFINAARTTLTTGNALMDQGRVTGFDIKKGNIRVDGDGLDTSTSDYTQILAKTTEINAAVYAKNLDVINGSNTVSYEANGADSIVTPKSSTGSNQATGVALDVSELGAMYAGKIRLIGTEKGMGVTNAGSIIASDTGGLQLNSNGNLINSGSLIANQGQINVANQGFSIENSGTIASSRASIDIDSDALTNSGVISSRDTLKVQQVGAIANSGEIAAGSFDFTASALNNSGKLLQTGTGQLAVDTKQLVNSQGGIIGQDLYADTSVPPVVTPDDKPPTTATNGSAIKDNTTEPSEPDATPLPVITHDGTIHAATVTNTGSVYSNGKVNIASDRVTNQDKSSLAVNRLDIANNGSLTNTNSRVQLENIDWQLANFDNTSSQITATKDISIRSADQITNDQGSIAAMGDIDLNAQNQLNNNQGIIQSNANVITKSSGFDNTKGSVSSKGDLTLDAKGDLTNNQGRITSEKDLNVSVKHVTNDKGSFSTQQQLDIVANQLDNSGQIYGQTGNQITLDGDLQNSGLIGSQANTTIDASSVIQTTSGSLIAGMQADGTLLETGNATLNLTARDNVVSQGKQIATGDIEISGTDLDLNNSITQAHNITMTAASGNISSQKATIVTKETLTLDSAQGSLNNRSGEISAQNFDIKAKRLDNTDGKINQTGNQDFTLNLAEGIDNTRGRIASNANNITLDTSILDNTSGAIIQTAETSTRPTSLTVKADQIINNQGQALSLGEQKWQIVGDIDNQNGVIQAQRFDITASDLDNTDGRILAVTSKDNAATQTKDSQLSVRGTLSNASSADQADKGAITSNTGGLTINAGKLKNNSQISSSQALTLNSDSLINSGSLYAKDITIDNQSNLSNLGSIAALDDTTINTGSLNQSSSGQLIAGLSATGDLGGSTDLTVISLGQQANAGTNIATGNMSFKGSDLDLISSRNQSSTLSLEATSGDINVDKAKTNVADTASLNTKGKLSNDDGVLQAGQFDWQISDLSNIAGTINQTGNQAFTLVTNGDINNKSGFIGGKAESLTINTQGQLNNTQGSIIHSADVSTNANDANSGATIIADSLLNQQGKLISNGKMTATVNQDFNNTKGGVQAKSLKVAADKLTNLNGQLVSQSDDLQLVATDIINRGENAYIQSGNNLTIEAKRLINSDKATVMAQGAATITAVDSFNNASGAVTASDEAMTINGGILNNDAQIASVNKGVTINISTVNNASLGRIQAATDTTIDTEQSLNNQGLIATTRTLKVTTGGDLNNQTGTLSADTIELQSQQNINNDSGLIVQSGTENTLVINSKADLSNKNTKAPANSDKQLGIMTNSDAIITSSSLDNQSGLITADNLTIDSLGHIGNKKGQLQASEQLTISATGDATLDNQGGQIGANTVDLIVGSANSGRINNNGAGSLIQAATDLTLTTGTLNNQSTKQSKNSEKNQGILAGNTLAIHASANNNTGGQLLANDKITIKASNQLNNQSGTINSQDVIIKDSNTSGRRLVVTNNQGLINANKDLSIKATGYSNAGGTISAVNQADIDVHDSIYYGQGDTINAADLKLTTQGNFTNSGKLSGQNALTLSANNIDNLKGAQLISNGTTALNVQSDIDNRGLINGINTYLDAGGTVNNYSNGRIYGDHVAIEAVTLNNTPDIFTKTKVDGCEAGPDCLIETTTEFNNIYGWNDQQIASYKNAYPNFYNQMLTEKKTYYEVRSEPAPVIAARKRLDIGVTTLNNNPNQARAGIFNEDFDGQAQIISNGELHIGGRLDSNHQATGRANTVTNKGASIESVDDMSISTNTLNNVNADFALKATKVETGRQENQHEYQINGSTNRYDESEVQISKGGHNGHWVTYLTTPENKNNRAKKFYEWKYDVVTLEDQVMSSDPSRILSGGQLSLPNTKLTNDKSIIIATQIKQSAGSLENDTLQATGYKTTEYTNKGSQEFYIKRKRKHDGWGSKSDKTYTKSAELPFVPSEELINLPILSTGIYAVAVEGTTDIGRATIDNSKVRDLKSINDAIKTLTQAKINAKDNGKTTSVDQTALEDATNLLSKFAKAENNQLTDAQKQQIQDLIAAQNNGKPVDAAKVKDLIENISTQIDHYAADEIRTSGNKIDLPNSGLFGTNPDSSADYLIETDPAFANYKNWLSSGYMLDRLKLDPSVTQKRLGDGYYEQQYIRDQIMMLTGRYYLGNYGDQDTQYKSLMDAGITAAQTLNLRPGIALTDNQVAKLTTDIVWLVAQNITLADGSSQSVLVPKVYTRQAASQIDGTGNLIAANNIDMSLSGDLNNQGNIVGHKQVKINANSLTNQNGGVIAGDYVQIGTQNDLNNLGGTLAANSAMQLNVGGDLNNQSITYNTQAVKGASNGSRTGIAQIASIYIGDGLKGQVDADGNPLTTFVANMGGNTTFTAGRLDNLGGSSLIDTKGNVALNAVNTSYQTNSIEDANNYFKQGESTDVGSQLRGNSDIIIKAGNNVTGTATQINSNSGTVGIKAGNDITFTEGRNTQNLSTATKTTSKDFLSKETTQDRFDSQSDNAITSNIEGNKVAMQAGNDISFTGTNAISDTGTTLSADGDIDILSAKNTESQSSSSQTKKSGLFGTGGGLGFTIGKQQTDDSNAQTALTHTASNIAAIDGNVIINAGGSYHQAGSNLIAGMGSDSSLDINGANRGNTVVRAQEINIDNALNVYANQSEQKFKQSGLTVSVSNSLIDNAKAIDSLVDAAGNTDSVRMKGMAAVAGALKTRSLAKEAASATKELAGGINADSLAGFGNTRIQATIGSQKSQSNSSGYSEQNQASTITTGNLALIATGAGKDSNIDINGSTLNVTNDALFQADNDFNVSGVAQNSNTRSNSKSSSAAIGGYASTGSGQGASFGITTSASKGKGYANNDTTTYANSQINVGNATTLDIGNDVNIKGGVINTDRAQGVIGGDVNIESLQDTATYDSKQKNMGFTADVDLKGAGSSLSLNGGKTDVNADYKAVNEQSGIFTGDGGFDIEVGDKTTLIGGAITTTDKALELGLNKYISKGGIITQDIENTTSYDGDAIQVGVSLGNTTGKPQATMNGLGYGTDGDSDSSTTRAGITGIAGNSGITTDNREEYAGKLDNVFDATRVNEELGAQTIITQEFGKEAPKAVGDFAASRQLDLIEQGKVDEADKWAEGGAYRVAMHTLVGAIATGSVEGALSSGTTAVSIPVVSRYLDEKGVDETTKNALLLGLSAGAGAIVGGDTTSAANSVNQTQNNYLNHIQLESWLKGLKGCNGNQKCITRVNNAYQKLDKVQQESFANDCETNYNYQRCGQHIKNYYAGSEKYKGDTLFDPKLYSEIENLGGLGTGSLRTGVTFNNDQFVSRYSRWQGDAAYREDGILGAIALGTVGVGGRAARTPVGRKGQQVDFPNPNAPKPRNNPATINGINYSGHAIDRMQERGYTPTVIENAIRNGSRANGNKPNTIVITDSINNFRVIMNPKSNKVITVITGVN